MRFAPPEDAPVAGPLSPTDVGSKLRFRFPFPRRLPIMERVNAEDVGTGKANAAKRKVMRRGNRRWMGRLRRDVGRVRHAMGQRGAILLRWSSSRRCVGCGLILLRLRCFFLFDELFERFYFTNFRRINYNRCLPRFCYNVVRIFFHLECHRRTARTRRILRHQSAILRHPTNVHHVDDDHDRRQQQRQRHQQFLVSKSHRSLRRLRPRRNHPFARLLPRRVAGAGSRRLGAMPRNIRRRRTDDQASRHGPRQTNQQRRRRQL